MKKSDVSNTSSPEDQKCKTLSQKFLYLEIYCDIDQHFGALSPMNILQMKNGFNIKI